MIRNILGGVFLILSVFAYSQESIRIGSGTFDPNKKTIRAQRSLGTSNETTYSVMRFAKLPSTKQRAALQLRGIRLLSYIQDNLYYVAVSENQSKYSGRGVNAPSIDVSYEVNPLWKIHSNVYEKIIPSYASLGDDIAKVNVIYFEKNDARKIEQAINKLGAKVFSHQKEFQIITIGLDLAKVEELAKTPYIKWIEYVNPPSELQNLKGRNLNGASFLNSTTLGRGLKGEGVVVGIWDGSMQRHPDLGNQFVTKEYGKVSSHGQHVSGTVGGSGLLDPKAKGMAPKASMLSWNFTDSGNGLSTEQEMLRSVENDGMALTQNSYGVPKTRRDSDGSCADPREYSSSAQQLDQLINMYPTLSHIFSVGNDQGKCMKYIGTRYTTSTKRAKNAIFVGAVDKNGNMSDFSSWGPTFDGRIVPHVSAMGVNTYSTGYDNGYEVMSGTSMASPVVSGVMALVYQRYKQLKGTNPKSSLAKAAMMNTATDRGNPGPDYQFGYGVIDGLKTVELLEKEQYKEGVINHGDTKTEIINVPSGVKELRVMLVWTDKAGKANSKALINDLDLRVSKGGITTLPWSLNPDQPEQNATRKIDRLNNQEQVTINNPVSGNYTVSIEAFEVPEGSQEYSLVYHFVTDELTLVYPNGNEKLNPGDELTVVWSSNGYEGDQSVEISYDGGVTYEVIEGNIPADQYTLTTTVPETISGQVKVRVVQDGTADKSDGVFTILQTPQNLKLTNNDECGTTTKLEWDAVPGATGYKVLKANVNDGTFTEVVAQVSVNSYDITGLTLERNIFTVVTVKGTLVSERAQAVIVEKSNPVDLATVALPFDEDFSIRPSNSFKLIKKSGVDHTYWGSPYMVGSASSAMILSMKGNSDGSTWNATDPFNTNPEALGKVKLCKLDATTLQSGEKLWLRVAGFVNGDSKMRVAVNNNPIPNKNAQTEVSNTAASGDRIMYWDLSQFAGTEMSLGIEAVVNTAQDSVAIGHIKIFKPVNDVSISFKAPEKSQTLTSTEIIEVKVRNNSGESLSNLPVSYEINGGTPIVGVVAGPIEPFGTATYSFAQKADFSEEDVAFNITAKVELPSGMVDEKPENNIAKDVTTRLGDYYLMPTDIYGNNIIAKVVPKGFTDPEGKALDYTSGIKGNTVIKPETNGQKSKIVFTEFNLEGKDKIVIRNGQLLSSPIIATLSGNLPVPFEYISTSNDGCLSFDFVSSQKDNASGWYAEISETDSPAEDPRNTFVLGSIAMYNGDYSLPTDVKVSILNKSTEDQNNVKVRYRYRIKGASWGAWNEETIAQVPVSTTYGSPFTFSNKIAVPAGNLFDIEAEVVNSDFFMEDNVNLREDIVSDSYCLSKASTSKWSSTATYFTEISKDGIINSTKEQQAEDSYPQYFRDVKFVAYKDAPSVIKVKLGKSVDGGKINLWVDWDNNKEYNETAVSVNTVAGQLEYDVLVDVPSATVQGDYFARFMVLSSGTVDSCFSNYNTDGETEDYMITVVDNFPITKDLTIVSSIINNGVNLSNSETVGIKIKNLGASDVTSFSVTYQLNNGAVVTETVSQTVPAFGELDYNFPVSADVSASGSHEFKFNVSLLGDQEPANDDFVKTIINKVPLTNGYYALDFDGNDDILNLGTLGGVDLKSSTYEMWINPESYGNSGVVGFGRLFEGKNATIFLCGERHTLYPDHSLIVAIAGGTYHTKLNAINLNKWQHVAVTYDDNSKAVKIYINGQSVDVINKDNTPAGAVDDNSAKELFVGNRTDKARAFEGMIDQIRIWDVVRTDTEVANNIHSTSVTGALAEFELVEGPSNDQITSGSFTGNIQNADVTGSKSTNIWQEVKVKFASYKVNDQVIDFETVGGNEDHVKSELKSTANIGTVVANFTENMDDVTVNVATTPQVSGTTTNDFTNSVTTPVKYILTANHLGKALTTEFEVELTKEQGTDADLVTFGAPSLIPVANVTSSDIDIPVDANEDITSLSPVITFTGAKAYIGSVEVTSGTAISGVDFTNPVVIKVVAANGRTTNFYTVSLVKEQVITWSPSVTTLTYGDPKLDLTGVINSGEQIVYNSSDPSVVTIAYNKAIIKGAGTATITASQPGTNNFSSATPVIVNFTVNKAPLRITADNKEIDYSDAIPKLTMTYAGFVNGEDESVITKPTISTTAVQNSPAADYPITLTGGLADNYAIQLVNGTLKIKNVPVHKITFDVKEGATKIDGALVLINGTTLTTVNGTTDITLKAGTYTYKVTKVGKEDVTGTIVLGAAIVELVEMIDTLPVFTIKYEAEANGSIVGTVSQNIKKGKNGVEVEAVGATVGYEFDVWDDGVATAKRTETNVQENKTYKAKFKLSSYAVKYIAGTGTITGAINQSVTHGTDGTTVTVTGSTGFVFAGWSDGVMDNPRTDKNVIGAISVTALYEQIYKMPYLQDFETADAKTPPTDWKNIGNIVGKEDNKWEFKKPDNSDYKSVGANGKAAYLSSLTYGISSEEDADLISPIFDLSENSEVEISFKQRLYSYFGSLKADLSYSIDGGNSWVSIKDDWNAHASYMPYPDNEKEFKVLVPQVARKSNVRFKWHYEGAGLGWAIDDVKLRDPNKISVEYTAGVDGDVTGKLNQVVNKGANSTEVTAIPNTGFIFYGWSDGIKDNPRTDINVVKDIKVVAYFEKVYKAPYTQDFELATGKTPPLHWYNLSNDSGIQIWEFKKTTNNNGISLLPVTITAILDSDGYGSGANSNVDLISPLFDLSNDVDVKLSFDHLYKSEQQVDYGTLSYSVDGGITWDELEKFSDTDPQGVKYEKNITGKVAGKSKVRFKWNYNSGWAWYWLVDNIKIESTKKQFTVKYMADSNGSITGTAVQQLDADLNTTEVTAVANAGYVFVKWNDGSTDNPRKDIVAKDVTYTAEFSKIYTVKYVAGVNGSITGVATQSLISGATTKQVKAVADVGYHFVKWSDNSTSETRTDKVTTDVTYTAVFKKDVVIKIYTVKYVADINGSIRGLTTQTLEEGKTTSEVKAVAGTGYHFVKWSDGLTSETRSDKVTAGVTYTAVFEKDSVIKSYTVKYVADANGSITGLTTQTLEEGKTTSEVKAVAGIGYHFVKWSDGLTSETRSDKVTAGVTYTAVFEKDSVIKSYTIKYVADANGSITGLSTQTLEEGKTTSEVKAVASTGYKFVKWSDGLTSETRTDKVTADVTYTAVFEKGAVFESYTVKYVADTNGSITGLTTQTLEEGKTTSEVKAVASTGYKFVKWSDGLTSETRTDVVKTDVTYTAEFLAVELSISKAFSPNNDGENDFWEINSDIADVKYNVSIYNRSGKLLYEKNNYDNSFDGTDLNGEKIAVGSYIYVVEVKSNQKSQVFKDWVYIKY